MEMLVMYWVGFIISMYLIFVENSREFIKNEDSIEIQIALVLSLFSWFMVLIYSIYRVCTSGNIKKLTKWYASGGKQ